MKFEMQQLDLISQLLSLIQVLVVELQLLAVTEWLRSAMEGHFAVGRTPRKKKNL